MEDLILGLADNHFFYNDLEVSLAALYIHCIQQKNKVSNNITALGNTICRIFEKYHRCIGYCASLFMKGVISTCIVCCLVELVRPKLFVFCYFQRFILSLMY